jgi:PAS domain S-box-containing protein
MNEHNPENIDQKDDSRLSEQFLNSLIDSQTNFLIRFDTSGHFTFANKPFLKKLGYKKSEIIGKHFSMVTIPDEMDKCIKAFHYCINHPGKVIPLAHKKIDKAGNLIDTEWEFVSVTNEENAVIAIQGIGRDVTQKLLAEKEVKATAEKLDAFIESINDHFFILDKDWKFARVNAAFEKITQKSRSELLGSVIWDMFPVISGTGFEQAYRKAADQNTSIRFTEWVESANMWFDTTVYPSAEGLTVFMKDTTEEKRAREDGMRTKNSLEALINNTEDLIWSVDRETRYVYMNKAYRSQIARLTGLEPQEGAYSYLHKGYTPQEIKRWNKYYRRALAGERYTIVNQSTDLLTKKVLSFEISFNPIYKTKGDITGVGCFSRNITSWLETEKAIVDQNERLRHIASLTSHELRRPVASMLGLINIMDRVNFFNPDNKEIIEHLLTVGNEIDEVIRLIVDKTFTADLAKDKYQSP